MTVPDKSSLIVVGAGRWGVNIISTAHQLGSLCAVVDKDPSAIAAVYERLGSNCDLKFYKSLTAALVNHPCANVVVATPPDSHFEVAEQAISQRRHVFVEKPLCTSLHSAQSLVKSANQAGVLLMVDHLLQYSPKHRTLIQAVKRNFVGKVTRVKMTRMNFGTVRTAENVLWSFTPHDISILLAICQDKLPQSVACVGQKVLSDNVEDYIDMTVHFPCGIQAQIEATWMHPLKERRLIVYGTKGSLILNESMPKSETPTLHGFQWSTKRTLQGSAVAIEKSEQDIDVFNQNHPVVEEHSPPPLKAALEHFLACIKSNKKPKTDGEEGVRVLKVLKAASESLKHNGAAVELKRVIDTSGIYVHHTAIVDDGVALQEGTRVWHFSHIMTGATLGKSCNIGQNVYIGGMATLGNNVKVQNNVSIYDNVTIEDDVFLGPSCVLTNVKTPRAHVNRRNQFIATTICKGATVGANATIVCGVKLGQYCFVGAGSVVTKDVAPHAMVYGNPATSRGWVSTIGTKLEQVAELGPGIKVLHCSQSKEVYALHENGTEESNSPCINRIAEDDVGFRGWKKEALNGLPVKSEERS